MVGERIISNPLTDEDLAGLSLLEKVWMRREILRSQLARFSKERRKKLIDTADLKTKWERYAFSRLMNMPSGKNLPMDRLVDEIELTFNFKLKHLQIRRLYKVKKRVYNQREQAKKLT
jgi:hypothetical protein